MGNFRWLHLSDFHVGKDDYGQIKLFQYILKHIQDCQEKDIIPDAIFITGDVADKGKKEQYDLFMNEFILPLKNIYEKVPKIYIVPGNHDVDREQCKLAAASLYDVLNGKQINFFDISAAGLSARNEIRNRFLCFQNSFTEELCFPVNGIFEEKGYFKDIQIKEDKTIGIIGLNTSWLSCSKDDKEKMTPGKYMLEEALAEIADSDYKLVLGHHPLSWFQPEQRQQIHTLLARHKAIYLHGHMHKNSGEYACALNTAFLTLQGGAAFQAREDEIYYNALQWGELDFEDRTIRIIPKKWGAFNQEFMPDFSDRLPETFREEGKDSYLFPMAVSVIGHIDKNSLEVPKKAPAGWHLMDEAFVKDRTEPAEESILKYFDGKEPSYNDIFSDFIPKRTVVSKIKNEFMKCNADGEIKCMMITGAGGEGKTTVLLQTARILVEEGWRALVLRQPGKDTQLYEKQILNMTKEGTWVICVDNCFTVAEKLFEMMKLLSHRGQKNVHFLLCSRDIDWNDSAAHRLPWREFANYSICRLRGIDKEDAEKIIAAWTKLGEKGLGKLKDLSAAEAQEKLLLSSQNEEQTGETGEGALLGALLSARYGDELQNHVRNMLLRLQMIPVKNETLLDAFAYIVAMHSERFSFLSKTVMAQIYNFELKHVKKYILGPLGDEAASAVSGDIIYTRHILIAKAARKIMDEEFHIDFDEIFIELVSAAVEAAQKGNYIEGLEKWRFISDNFLNKNNSLAIRIDKKILDIERYSPYIVVHLSSLYRTMEQPEMAMKLFREVSYAVDHRPFFCEWALVEANMDNKAASICLSALALSDQVAKKPIDVKNACMNLYSIGRTFMGMYFMFKNTDYLYAADAAAAIGKKINQEDGDIKNLKNSTQKELEKEKIPKKRASYKQDLQKGISLAAKDREIEFAEWIPHIEGLEYKRLFALAGI